MKQHRRAIQDCAGQQVTRLAQHRTDKVGDDIPNQSHLIGCSVTRTIRVKCQDEKNRQSRARDPDYLIPKGSFLWLWLTPRRHCPPLFLTITSPSQMAGQPDADPASGESTAVRTAGHALSLHQYQ